MHTLTRPKGQSGPLTRVFVYGTLLAGESNHWLLLGARLVAEVRTTPAFELRDFGEFPGLASGGEHAVAGEVYEVDERMLAALDRFEDHPRLYQRARIALEDGETAEAYLVSRRQVAGLPMIACGSWRARKGASSRLES